MKTDALFDTRYLMHRDPSGKLKPVPMTRFMFESSFTAEERERLDRGLPVDIATDRGATDSGRWADMVAITCEMLTHWDETP
jgi:hypothetical protein